MHPAGVLIPLGSSVRLTVTLVRGPPLTTTEDRGGHGRGMPASEPRYCVAEVTEEARDGWRDFSDRFDVDRTALAEVIGLALGDMDGRLPQILAGWVDEARALKNERRRRG